MTQRTDAWNPQTVGIALAAYQPDPVWFAEQLASIAAQTYEHFFCVVTLDSPMEEIRSNPALSPYLSDTRFIWIENSERLGILKNFQRAINEATRRNADVIALSDQDDVWLPNKISLSIQEIRRRGPRSMVYCDAYILVGNVVLGETLHSHTLKIPGDLNIEERILRPQVSGFCMMMDADLARSFPEVPEIADHHDYWYSLVAATHNGVHRIEIPLAKYRQHESNMVGIASIRSLQGWANTSSSSSIRERVVRRALVAQHVGKTLPVSFLRRLLYRNKMGWALSLLIVIAQRSFSNQYIVNVARRHFFELMFLFPSQRGNILHLRNKIPLQGNLKHLFAIFFSVAAATLLFATNSLGGRLFTLGFSLALGSVACLALSLLRIFQHQVPKTGVVALGAGCTLAWLLSAFFGEPIVSVMALALPLLAYASYRLHWRRHTGF